MKNFVFPLTFKVKLTNLESKVINEIVKDSRISKIEIAKKLGIGFYTAKEYIGKLKEKGVLKRIGSNNGYWKILKK